MIASAYDEAICCTCRSTAPLPQALFRGPDVSYNFLAVGKLRMPTSQRHFSSPPCLVSNLATWEQTSTELQPLFLDCKICRFIKANPFKQMLIASTNHIHLCFFGSIWMLTSDSSLLPWRGALLSRFCNFALGWLCLQLTLCVLLRLRRTVRTFHGKCAEQMQKLVQNESPFWSAKNLIEPTNPGESNRTIFAYIVCWIFSIRVVCAFAFSDAIIQRTTQHSNPPRPTHNTPHNIPHQHTTTRPRKTPNHTTHQDPRHHTSQRNTPTHHPTHNHPRHHTPQHTHPRTLLFDTLAWHSSFLTLFARHSFLTLLLDTFSGNSCLTLLLGTLAGRFCWALLLGTLAWHSSLTLLLDTFAGHSCLALLLDTLAGHSC